MNDKNILTNTAANQCFVTDILHTDTAMASDMMNKPGETVQLKKNFDCIVKVSAEVWTD